MNVIHGIAALAVRAATIAFVAGVTLSIFLALDRLDVPLHGDPAVQVLAIAGLAAWRLYHGSTPAEEIRRFLGLEGANESVGLRSNKRSRGP